MGSKTCDVVVVEASCDKGVAFVLSILEAKLQQNRKSDELGIVLCSSSADVEFGPPIDDDENVDGMGAPPLEPIDRVTMDMYRRVHEFSAPKDGLDLDDEARYPSIAVALAKAASMIARRTKKLKYKRNIIFVASKQACEGESFRDGGAHAGVLSDIKASEISVIVCPVNSESDPFAVQTKGSVMSAAEFSDNWHVVPDLSVDSVITKPAYRPKLDGSLRFPGGLHLRIKMSAIVQQARIPTMKSVSALALEKGTDGECAVKLDRVYYTKDAPTNFVSAKERRKAYVYGNQMVSVEKDNLEELKVAAKPGILVLGFVAAANLPRHLFLEGSDILYAHPDGEHSKAYFSALVAAMVRENRRAIVRVVSRRNADMKLCALSPYTPQGAERPHSGALVLNYLPFDEDIRRFPFASLDATKRECTSDHTDAADALIDALSGEKDEYLPDLTKNPALKRLYDSIHARALDAKADLADDAALSKCMRARVSATVDAQRAISLFRGAMGIEQKEVKSTSAAQDSGGFWSVKTKDGEDCMFSAWNAASDESRVPDAVGSISPVEDYWAIIRGKDARASSGKVFADMVAQIDAFLSEGLAYVEKAAECIVALRQGSLEVSTDVRYNAFIRALKERVIAAKGSESDTLTCLWKNHISMDLAGLITKSECAAADASDQEADTFYTIDKLNGEGCDAAGGAKIDEEYDDDDIMDMD